GRPQAAPLGVSRAGAIDTLALRIGNRLVGNHENAAAIEMTSSGGNFVFHQDAWIALTGADCQPSVDGIPMAMWYSFRISKGQRLSTSSIDPGFRSYLCIYGGIDVPLVLGSRSTFLPGHWGGHRGRDLVSGDVLKIGTQGATVPGFRRAGILIRALYR